MNLDIFGGCQIRSSDIVFTPDLYAEDIVSWCKPEGLCLDPCSGDGAFSRHLPSGSDYCEITEGSDFFEYDKQVDWIIGNPPYSIFEQFLNHSFRISENVCFLVPTNKIFQRPAIYRAIDAYGGIEKIRIYGEGRNLGFPFGFSVGAFHFKKDAKSVISYGIKAKTSPKAD